MEALLIDARYAAGLNGAGAGCDMECSLIPWGGVMGMGLFFTPSNPNGPLSMKLGCIFFFFFLIHIMLEEE